MDHDMWAYREISNDASGCAQHKRGRKYNTTEGNGAMTARLTTTSQKKKSKNQE
jgi:hypothetical protein